MKHSLFFGILFVSTIFFSSCSPELFVIEGDTIAVHYVGTLDNGEEFDSSRKPGRTPLSFTVGKQEVIRGFDEGVLDMKIGESKNLAIEPADAYGEEVVIQDFARWQLDDFFADEEPEVGQTFEANGFSVTILSVDEETVKLQYPNPHHLAGERLNFEVELLAINPECGDGKKEHDAVEMCDDGNTENGDGCDKKCALEE